MLKFRNLIKSISQLYRYMEEVSRISVQVGKLESHLNKIPILEEYLGIEIVWDFKQDKFIYKKTEEKK